MIAFLLLTEIAFFAGGLLAFRNGNYNRAVLSGLCAVVTAVILVLVV